MPDNEVTPEGPTEGEAEEEEVVMDESTTALPDDRFDR